jgi:hypothetical protein
MKLFERLHVHTIRERRSLRWFLSDLHDRREISGQFAAFYSGCGVGVHIGNDEHPVQLNVCIPYVLGTFVSLSSPVLHKWAERVAKLWPSAPNEGNYVTRSLELRVHNWAIWWSVWSPRDSWSSKTPRWRDGNWHPLGHHQRQSETELERREVTVLMPERAYKGAAVLNRTTWGFERLPRMFDGEGLTVQIDMHEGEAIPHPGKGENSWDCGEDATYGTSGPARSIEEAVGKLQGSVMERRRRYGGKNWVPEAKRPAVVA